MIIPIAAGQRVVLVASAFLIAVVLLISLCKNAASVVPIREDKAERSWPMFGGGPGRNMVNADERDLPADWCIQEGKRKNIQWAAELGDRTIGSPVVSGGKVFVSTNNAKPRDPNVQGHKAVMMAFRESDGEFLWQIAHEVPDHWSRQFSGALSSTPAVVGGRLHYVTSAGEVVCADAEQGKILWRYDMIKELKVHPYREWCSARISPSWSSPLVVGNHVFAATGNGVDVDGNLVSPKAPSFIALDRQTGKLVWQSNLPGANIVEAAWSSPAFSDHDGRPQVVFAGGDGVIYSFVPETGELLWKCDCLPARKDRTEKEPDNQFVGSPVVVGDKLYVGLGLPADSWKGSPRWSYFLCLDITKKGDVSLKSYDAKAAANKGSALVWAFGGPIEPRPERGPRVYFGPTVSTAAVHQGLIYITEQHGYLHCLDAATGSRIWVYDCVSMLLGSPYLVDDRVFVGTEEGEVLIFSHQRAARILATIDLEEPISTTPAAANGRLYVATRSKLFAIGSR